MYTLSIYSLSVHPSLGASRGEIVIVAEEVQDSKYTISMQLSASHLDKKDFFGKVWTQSSVMSMGKDGIVIEKFSTVLAVSKYICMYVSSSRATDVAKNIIMHAVETVFNFPISALCIVQDNQYLLLQTPYYQFHFVILYVCVIQALLDTNSHTCRLFIMHYMYVAITTVDGGSICV